MNNEKIKERVNIVKESVNVMAGYQIVNEGNINLQKRDLNKIIRNLDMELQKELIIYNFQLLMVYNDYQNYINTELKDKTESFGLKIQELINQVQIDRKQLREINKSIKNFNIENFLTNYIIVSDKINSILLSNGNRLKEFISSYDEYLNNNSLNKRKSTFNK